MLVMKFGGTSVADAQRIRAVAGIVRSRLNQRPLVVVSAMAGVTDELVRLCDRAVSGKNDAGRLVERHFAVARELGLAPAVVQNDLLELDRTLGRVRRLGRTSARNRDLILSFGERLSSRLVAGCLVNMGIPARPVMSYEAGMVTDDEFGNAEPLPEARRHLGRVLRKVKGVGVITGFLGRNRAGSITTLGRGGSDFTASLVGSALGASEVEIWTDVSGVMSADPRVVPEAHTIRRLSFAEGAELAYFGAKVLHHKTLFPAMAADIPVRVLNTCDPDDPGTVVTRKARGSTGAVKAIACKKGISVVNVVSTRMLLAHGFLARLFKVFADHSIVVDVLSTSEVSVSLTVDRTERLADTVRDLARFAEVRVTGGRALISVVGDGLAHRPGLAGRVFSALGKKGVNVEMISQGASRNNLSLVVNDNEADRCVRSLHREIFGRRRR